MAARALLFLTTFLCLLASASSVLAAPADLDRSFGGDGIVAVEGPTGATSFPSESAARLAIGPRDEVFVLYSSYPPCEPPIDCQVELTVVRYDAQGRRDASFGTGGPQLVVRQSAFAHKFDIAVGADGRPVITAFNEPEDFLTVARLTPDGHLDESFGVGGRTPHLSTHTIEVARTIPVVAVQSDGKILLAGEANRGAESSEMIVARLLSNGQFDTSFGDGGEVKITVPTQSLPAKVLFGPDGSVTVPGPMCCIGGGLLFGGGFSVVRLLSDGRLDTGWAGSGRLFFPTPGAEGAVETAALAPDGGLFVSFEASTSTVSVPGTVLKLRPGGTPDPGFGREGEARLYPRVGSIDPSDIAVDPKGRLVGVGWRGKVSLFRLRPDGSADRTFNGGQHLLVPFGGDKSTPYQVALQSTGRIVALAESGSIGGKGFGLIALRGGTDHDRCLGKRATIVGTQGPDEIVGTPHRDVIAALGGKDYVRGLGSPDLICGGKGHDKLLGGPGRDQVKQ